MNSLFIFQAILFLVICSCNNDFQELKDGNNISICINENDSSINICLLNSSQGIESINQEDKLDTLVLHISTSKTFNYPNNGKGCIDSLKINMKRKYIKIGQRIIYMDEILKCK